MAWNRLQPPPVKFTNIILGFYLLLQSAAEKKNIIIYVIIKVVIKYNILFDFVTINPPSLIGKTRLCLHHIFVSSLTGKTHLCHQWHTRIFYPGFYPYTQECLT